MELGTASWANYLEWKEQVKGFSGLAAYTLQSKNLSGTEGAERLEAVAVTANLFDVLGVHPRLGRGFLPEEDARNAAPVVVLREGLWQRRFGANPSILGQTVTLDGQPYTVIGVMPETARFPAGSQTDIFIPLVQPADVNTQRGYHFLSVVGRLSEGVALETAHNELRQVARRLEEAYPTMEEVIGGSVAERRLNLLLLGTFALIALMLATAGLYGVISYLVAQRTREIGIRVALGARTRDVVWLVMRQGGRLTAVGIAVGIVGALGLSRVMESLLYGVSARDPLTLAALAAFLGCVALVATWLPARRAARVDPVIAIKSE
ncbi:ABC transporter permease [Hyalangium sp.]|uniref:ABC transporter permease n=1 Tax=Hyalangium sp. TaxID=2028555 RepID=UPI002D2E752A|nr:ABC transporter permease [Hyalangium sp.]HYI02528.1 ABC transporter permease [Hyalangium sp.]